MRREISPSGKSRAFVNDTPVNLDTLRRVTNELMDIHSQHDSIMLGNNEFQLQVVDVYAQTDKYLKKYRKDFRLYREAREAYDAMKKSADRLRKEFDYNNFLYQELSEAGIAARASRRNWKMSSVSWKMLSRLRKNCNWPMTTSTTRSSQCWIYAQRGSRDAHPGVSRLVNYYATLRDRAQSALIELRDLADEVSNAGSMVELDDARSTIVRERLDLIYQLLKKTYG